MKRSCHDALRVCECAAEALLQAGGKPPPHLAGTDARRRVLGRAGDAEAARARAQRPRLQRHLQQHATAALTAAEQDESVESAAAPLAIVPRFKNA